MIEEHLHCKSYSTSVRYILLNDFISNNHQYSMTMSMETLRIFIALYFIATPDLTPKKIVKDASGEMPTNPEPCLLTCAGSTGAGITEWTTHSPDKISTDVDISECGFVDVPVVTTSMAGIGLNEHQKGVSAPLSITKTGFKIAVLVCGKNPIPLISRQWLARQYKWHVNWIAVGYNCA